jgi:hypothetical protein
MRAKSLLSLLFSLGFKFCSAPLKILRHIPKSKAARIFPGKTLSQFQTGCSFLAEIFRISTNDWRRRIAKTGTSLSTATGFTSSAFQEERHKDGIVVVHGPLVEFKKTVKELPADHNIGCVTLSMPRDYKKSGAFLFCFLSKQAKRKDFSLTTRHGPADTARQFRLWPLATNSTARPSNSETASWQMIPKLCRSANIKVSRLRHWRSRIGLISNGYPRRNGFVIATLDAAQLLVHLFSTIAAYLRLANLDCKLSWGFERAGGWILAVAGGPAHPPHGWHFDQKNRDRSAKHLGR